jgi:hypothetical protein
MPQRAATAVPASASTAARSPSSGRQDPSDALSMMVSSMVHMVQAGKTQSAASRWSA